MHPSRRELFSRGAEERSYQSAGGCKKKKFFHPREDIVVLWSPDASVTARDFFEGGRREIASGVCEEPILGPGSLGARPSPPGEEHGYDLMICVELYMGVMSFLILDIEYDEALWPCIYREIDGFFF